MSSQQASNPYLEPRAIAIAEPLRLAALGTATYLSYWRLFFALCRTCSGSSTTGGR